MTITGSSFSCEGKIDERTCVNIETIWEIKQQLDAWVMKPVAGSLREKKPT